MEQVEVTTGSTTKTRTSRRVLALVVILAVSVAFLAIGVNKLGYWLVVADPLDEARAIVVLSGHLPFRAMEAASIYKGGWAPEVWLTRVSRPVKESALARLGIRVPREEMYNRQVLEQLGVPGQKVRLLSNGVQNTLREIQLIAQELKHTGGEQVILVTSKVHTRRVRATWRAVVGDSLLAIVRYPAEDPYNPDRWWRQTRDALSVSRELFGLMNVWAGFPLRPERQ